MGRPRGNAVVTQRDRTRVACQRLIGDGVPITRRALRAAGVHTSDDSMTILLDGLIADGTIRPEHLHANHPASKAGLARQVSLPVSSSRSPREEDRVELPPLRQHAPDAPWLTPAPPEVPLWEWLAAKYWTPGRRALYARGMA